MHRTCQHIVVACALLAGAPLTLWAGEPQQAQALQQQSAQAAPEFAQNVVMPQSRVFSVERLGQPISIADIHANIQIGDKTASTTMDVQLRNPLRQTQQAQVLLAVPEGAVLRGFSLPESAQECAAQVVSGQDARPLIRALAARTRDAACIEFAGYDLVRSGVFTIGAQREQRVQILYDSPLVPQLGRLDYCLPRSELLENLSRWRINVQVESQAPISTAYSPSHALQMKRESANSMLVGLPGGSTNEPGSFRLSVLPDSGSMAATLYTYPDATAGGGFFLFLAGLPAHPPKAAAGAAFPKREVTLVIDQSGSMNDGNHLDQVRSAGKKILDQLQPGEWFNIITFNDRVQSFAAAPVAKNVENTIAAGRFLAAMDARGGTNIYDALARALRQRLPADNLLPIILFVTDGVPTAGQTSETIIRNLARDGNPDHRRIYTFGIGVEINVPLLQNLASSTRGRAAFVMSNQNVEQRLTETFDALARPMLTDAQIDLAAGAEAKGKLEAAAPQMPELLSDVFEDGQVTVVGRYEGQGPLQFRLSGNYLGKVTAFEYGFPAAAQAPAGGNAFVPRLWASRRIGNLVDQVRQLGADGGAPPLMQLAGVGAPVAEATPAAPRQDVRGPARELARLSRENGVLTEYTFFFASDRTELTDEEKVVTGVESRLQKRAVEDRYGNEAINQDYNIMAQRDQAALNFRNRMVDARTQAGHGPSCPTGGRPHSLPPERALGGQPPPAEGEDAEGRPGG